MLIFTQQSLYTYYHNNVRFKFVLEPKLLQATPTLALGLAHLPGRAGWVALSSVSRGSRDMRLKSSLSTSTATKANRRWQTRTFLKATSFFRNYLHSEGLAWSWDKAWLLPSSELLGCLPLAQPQCRMKLCCLPQENRAQEWWMLLPFPPSSRWSKERKRQESQPRFCYKSLPQKGTKLPSCSWRCFTFEEWQLLFSSSAFPCSHPNF